MKAFNCHDAESLMFAERDGALTEDKRTALEAHTAGCKSCSDFRHAIATTARHMHDSVEAVRVPDADSEWREIRRRIQKAEPAAPIWARLLPALGIPLAAAAALAIAFIAAPQWFERTGVADSAEIAPETALVAWEPHAEFVEIPGSDDSMVVYLDEPSGWLVVWAVGSTDGTGG
ncbi:MAG TPA: zf-HC2 domain-containing protein [Opitutaceae bacterium]|nr:zf-HC2 domain-containing protein [Opitutaceae bacterium]